MSVPEIQPHVAALMAKLDADLTPFNIGLALGVGPAQLGGPYVALYPSAGYADDMVLCGDRSWFEIRVFLHCIGDGPEQAQWVADKARLSLLGSPPVVATRTSHRMRQDTNVPNVYRDTTVQPPAYIQALQFTWATGSG